MDRFYRRTSRNIVRDSRDKENFALRKFLIELVVVALIVGWILAKHLDLFSPWIPALCLVVLWHLLWDVGKALFQKSSVRYGSIKTLLATVFTCVIASIGFLVLAHNALGLLEKKEGMLNQESVSPKEPSPQPVAPKEIKKEPDLSGVSLAKPKANKPVARKTQSKNRPTTSKPPNCTSAPGSAAIRIENSSDTTISNNTLYTDDPCESIVDAKGLTRSTITGNEKRPVPK
jgi:hypothetical protein